MEKKEKVKKPFYKKLWFIILVVIIIGTVISNNELDDDNHKEIEEIDWNADIDLSEMLPEPDSNKAEIVRNNDDSIGVYIYKISKDEYRSYVNECEDKGYNLEVDKTTTGYSAFNEDGWKLSLSYYENDREMHIYLDAPMKMMEIQWPRSEVAQLLPFPKSTVGKFSTDTSDRLFVYIGNTSIEDYNKYVNECSENGFTVDYDKGEKYYNAEDLNGNELSLHYIGGNVMTIEISKNKKLVSNNLKEENEIIDTNDSKVPEKTETTNNSTSKETSKETSTINNGMRPEFKEAMDSYEAFMDEYCTFMKKYADSNGEDLSLLADYSSYLSEYTEFLEDFEKWDSDEEMNNTELAYYIDVQARVNKKLLEISE